MGKYWTTPEQRIWLSSHITNFLDAQELSTVDRFFKGLNNKWFVAYPEENYVFPCAPGTTRPKLTNVESVLLSKVRAARKALNTDVKNLDELAPIEEREDRFKT
ncbi:hypothetical protein BD779DRAFT_1481063 [Infundibulicybe gibba]|nr:hypothetical protein BD779DRAFT_1481063 [Infundibulicybe gibba]